MNGKNLFDIAGRKAIVTGGTRGLGYGMAEGLMEAGCEVAIVGTSAKVHDVAKGFCARGFWATTWISWSTPTASSAATAQRNFPLRSGTWC